MKTLDGGSIVLDLVQTTQTQTHTHTMTLCLNYLNYIKVFFDIIIKNLFFYSKFAIFILYRIPNGLTLFWKKFGLTNASLEKQLELREKNIKKLFILTKKLLFYQTLNVQMPYLILHKVYPIHYLYFY